MQGEDEDAAESVAEAGNEFSNLSIGLVAFVCVIMGKLEIYCYYGEGREREEGRKEAGHSQAVGEGGQGKEMLKMSINGRQEKGQKGQLHIPKGSAGPAVAPPQRRILAIIEHKHCIQVVIVEMIVARA